MLYSRCGLDCESCPNREEYGCAGCENITYGYWGERCEIKECCEKKQLSCCGMCRNFPCALLLEFSYDKDTGDDGERLLNCKKRADEQLTHNERFIKRLLLGISLGGVAGFIVGEILKILAPYLIGGIIIGLGIAVMLNISDKR